MVERHTVLWFVTIPSCRHRYLFLRVQWLWAYRKPSIKPYVCHASIKDGTGFGFEFKRAPATFEVTVAMLGCPLCIFIFRHGMPVACQLT